MKAIKGFLALTLIAVCILLFTNLSNSEILLQTGFEKDKIGDIPKEPPDIWEASGAGFEVDDSHVKEGKQSLALPGGGGNQALGALIDTPSEVVTAEFWLYVEGAERSLTFFTLSADSALTDWAAGGSYINWIEEIIRHYIGAWNEIGPMTSDEWHYVRIVTDTSESIFDVYVADTVTEVHAGEPLGKDLGFRSDIAVPSAKICFSTYGLISPAYVDELLVYEGGVLPKGIFAVKPEGKLALTWGKIKER